MIPGGLSSKQTETNTGAYVFKLETTMQSINLQVFIINNGAAP